jgi:hypothetical protein
MIEFTINNIDPSANYFGQQLTAFNYLRDSLTAFAVHSCKFNLIE